MMRTQVNNQPLYIGIDLGGTNIVCGAVTADGDVLHKIKQPTETSKGSDYVINKIANMVKEIVRLAANDGSPQAVGLGCPGLVDPSRGIAIGASNLGWYNIEAARILASLTSLPVYVDNDVRMYVYGEAMIGAGKPYNHVLGVTLGTGLACAYSVKGQLFYGNGFMAGELGHIRGAGIQYACNCGKTGCYETVLSATGIVRQAIEQLERGRDSVLRVKYNNEDYSRLTAADVSEGYDQHDPLCIEVMHHTGHTLGHALAAAGTLYSPDVIIVGGGASNAGERLLAPARETLYAELLPGLAEAITLTTAALTDDAGVIGSALFASQRYHSKEAEQV